MRYRTIQRWRQCANGAGLLQGRMLHRWQILPTPDPKCSPGVHHCASSVTSQWGSLLTVSGPVLPSQHWMGVLKILGKIVELTLQLSFLANPTLLWLAGTIACFHPPGYCNHACLSFRTSNSKTSAPFHWVGLLNVLGHPEDHLDVNPDAECFKGFFTTGRTFWAGSRMRQSGLWKFRKFICRRTFNSKTTETFDLEISHEVGWNLGAHWRWSGSGSGSGSTFKNF